MKFQCSATDGPAQTGILHIKNKKVKTPALFFPADETYHLPSFAECYIGQSTVENNDFNPCITIGNSIFFNQSTSDENNDVNNHLIIPDALPEQVKRYVQKYDQQQSKEIIVLPSDITLTKELIKGNESGLFIISNAAHLFSNPKKFSSYIAALRELISYDALVYTPSIATPETLGILVYLGCDLFDVTSAILAASKKKFFLPHTTLNAKEIDENPCYCPICSQTTKHPSKFSFQQILQHNYYQLHQELLIIRNAIQNNTLRDLVEQKVRSSSQLVTLLRYIDNEHYSYIEKRTPMSMPESYILQATSRESANRSEIKRFQQRIKNRYQKPKEKKILLLLPCSARKPYSFSKSHQRLQKAISKTTSPATIHEVIVTSPLGLVPRELELTYPASSYDISVTGEWFEDEKKLIQEQLETFLSTNQYEAIISHLPETLVQPPNHQKKPWHFSLIENSSTSKKSLASLTTLLNNALNSIESKSTLSKSDQKKQQVEQIAAFQFGKRLARTLLKDTIVKGKYPYLKIFDEYNQQLGMIPDGRGLISLTAEGGEKICHFSEYTVTIDTGFTVKGSILSPGVINADDSIRRGDDVIVIQGEDYLGVGVAMMNGNEMKKRLYGEAVNMRHKIKKEK